MVFGPLWPSPPLLVYVLLWKTPGYDGVNPRNSPKIDNKVVNRSSRPCLKVDNPSQTGYKPSLGCGKAVDSPKVLSPRIPMEKEGLGLSTILSTGFPQVLWKSSPCNRSF